VSYEIVARAEALVDAGRPHQAIELLSKELAIAPDDVAMLRILIRAQLLVDPAAALASAQLLVAREPESEDGHYFAALAYDELGNRKAAVQSARTAMALAPDDPHVLMAFAITRSRRPRGRGEGMRAAKRAIELAPEDSAGYVAAGAVELHAGHWRRSAKWFERALEIDQHDQMAQINLAIAKQGAGNVAAALGGVDGMLRFDPNDKDAREVLDDVVYTTLVHLLWVVLVLLYVVEELHR
jgi:tetratricopeptide (TPR) repeat protein